MISRTVFVGVCLYAILSNTFAISAINHRTLKKTLYHTKKAISEASDILTRVTVLKNESGDCNKRLQDVTDDLEKACQAIKNIGGSTVDISDGQKRRTLLIDAKANYISCKNKLLGNGHMTASNAEIWCLRTALWQNNHFDDSGTDSLAIYYECTSERNVFAFNNPILNSVEEEPSRRTLSSYNSIADNRASAEDNRHTRKLRRIAPRDITKPGTGYRIRKEYRALTVEERKRYHNAVRELYLDGTFSSFALVHRIGTRLKGTQGEAFLPWHRAFLALYEEALRQVDPSVSLPYLDTTIDYNMVTPLLSIIWDEHHLGTGCGIVDDGPFAGFVTNDNPLRRNIGQGLSSLLRPEKLDAIFGFCRLGDVFRRIESWHNGVHRWVGGTMGGSMSASDPVFYMHQAFIDYIWEQFREHQRSDVCGNIDPEFDYPVFSDNTRRPTKSEHMPDSEMGGMDFLLNRRGVENFWTKNWYGYDERPTCANNCSNSEDMFCDTDIGLCVGKMSEDVGEFPGPPRRRKRQVPSYTTGIYASIAEASSQTVHDICFRQPYYRDCPKPPPPETDEEIASAMVNDELPMSERLDKVRKKLLWNRDKVYQTPPESELTFFRDISDVRNDCRTIDTAIYDLILAMLRGRRVI